MTKAQMVRKSGYDIQVTLSQEEAEVIRKVFQAVGGLVEGPRGVVAQLDRVFSDAGVLIGEFSSEGAIWLK